jgi:hypothetical protein
MSYWVLREREGVGILNAKESRYVNQEVWLIYFRGFFFSKNHHHIPKLSIETRMSWVFALLSLIVWLDVVST